MGAWQYEDNMETAQALLVQNISMGVRTKYSIANVS